jgi:hypothetical protein
MNLGLFVYTPLTPILPVVLSARIALSRWERGNTRGGTIALQTPISS